MENVTKALLIATAVLIVIIIIALGIKLLGKTKDTSEQTDIMYEEIEKKTDNLVEGFISNLQVLNRQKEADRIFSKIEKYKGEIKGKQIKELADLAKKYNSLEDKKSRILVVVSSDNVTYKWGRRIEPDEDGNYKNFFKGVFSNWCDYKETDSYKVEMFERGGSFHIYILNKNNIS